MLKVDKCDAKKRSNCKKPEEIEAWISTKSIFPLAFNKRPNFGAFHSTFVEGERYIPSVKLGQNRFTDTGYRYRINNFEQ